MVKLCRARAVTKKTLVCAERGFSNGDSVFPLFFLFVLLRQYLYVFAISKASKEARTNTVHYAYSGVMYLRVDLLNVVEMAFAI